MSSCSASVYIAHLVQHVVHISDQTGIELSLGSKASHTGSTQLLTLVKAASQASRAQAAHLVQLILCHQLQAMPLKAAAGACWGLLWMDAAG